MAPRQKVTDNGIYACEFCERTYDKKPSLASHRRTIHKEELASSKAATCGGSRASAPGVEEESNFSAAAKEHVKKTNDDLIEAGDDAEIFDAARIASQKARERMEPEEDWLAKTLHLDDWLPFDIPMGNMEEKVEGEEESSADKEETGEQELDVESVETVEITAMSQEVAPENTPLPETPHKLKQRECDICRLYFSSMIHLMNHVVEAHGVETGGTSPEMFMMAELLANTKDQLEATRIALEAVHKENMLFRQQQMQMKQTMIQDMTEVVRKVVRKEINEKEKEKEEDVDEAEVLREGRSKRVKCDECDFETDNKKKLVGHKKVKHVRGEYPCLVEGCNRWFKNKTDLDHHKGQMHCQKFSCSKCPLTFSKKEGLEHHTRVDHKPAQPESNTIECGECGIKGVSGEQMNQHMVRVHGQGFKPVKAQQCRYFKTRRGCDKGDACPFSHGGRGGAPAGQGEDRREECRHGRQCTYQQRPQGCKFRHSEPGSRQPLPRHQQQQHRGEPARRRIRCDNRMEDCPKVPNCPFVHSMEEFPTLQAAQAPRACRWQEDCNRVPNCPFVHYNGGFQQRRSNQNRN